jgi:signal peptidase II
VRGLQERGPVAPVGRGERRRLLLPAGIVAAVVAADQLTKTMAERGLVDGPVHLVWTLRLNLSYNRGAAFGLGQHLGPVLVAVAVVVLVAVLAAGRSLAARPLALVAVGLLLGGAVGNLADRVVRDNGGAVIDFIDLQWWPVFNVADMAITAGAVLLVLVGRDRQPERQRQPEQGQEQA